MSDIEDRKKLKDAIANNETIQLVLLNHRKDGSPFWNLLHISPLKNITGNIVFMFGGQVEIEIPEEKKIPSFILDESAEVVSGSEDDDMEMLIQMKQMYKAWSKRSKDSSYSGSPPSPTEIDASFSYNFIVLINNNFPSCSINLANDRFCDWFGISLEYIVQLPILTLMGKHLATNEGALLRKSLELNKSARVVGLFNKKPFAFYVTPLLGKDSNVKYFLGILVDLST